MNKIFVSASIRISGHAFFHARAHAQVAGAAVRARRAPVGPWPGQRRDARGAVVATAAAAVVAALVVISAGSKRRANEKGPAAMCQALINDLVAGAGFEPTT
ncbi:hypothetical protein, partial [Bordetella pertussis]|uniref:hypothetical protein n=1 Tax=Bordetella pertussis TaxID=520 RepID=UPI0017847DDC